MLGDTNFSAFFVQPTAQVASMIIPPEQLRYPIGKAGSLDLYSVPAGVQPSPRVHSRFRSHRPPDTDPTFGPVREQPTITEAPSKRRSVFGNVARKSAGFLQRACSLQPGVHAAEASSSNRDRTGNGPVIKSRSFLSTFGSGRSSPWLKPGASRPKIGEKLRPHLILARARGPLHGGGHPRSRRGPDARGQRRSITTHERP